MGRLNESTDRILRLVQKRELSGFRARCSSVAVRRVSAQAMPSVLRALLPCWVPSAVLRCGSRRTVSSQRHCIQTSHRWLAKHVLAVLLLNQGRGQQSPQCRKCCTSLASRAVCDVAESFMWGGSVANPPLCIFFSSKYYSMQLK